MTDLDPTAYERHVKDIRSKRTGETYGRAARKLEEWIAASGKDLAHAQPGELDHYVSWLVEQKLAPATIKLMVIGGMGYLDWKRNHGASVVELVTPDLPKIPPPEPFVLTDKELALFLRRVSLVQEPARTISIFIAFTGLRGEECVSLELSNLRQTEMGNLYFEVRGKGGKRRMVPWPAQARSILNDYLRGYRAEQKSSKWMFPSIEKSHYKTLTLREYFRWLREELGIGDLTPHVLRHTYITFLDRHNVPVLMIGQIVGHEMPGVNVVTQRNYVNHPVDEMCAQVNRVPFPFDSVHFPSQEEEQEAS